MKPLLLVVATLAISTQALAEGYTSPDIFHFSLANGEQANEAVDADLHVAPTLVVAKYGVKRSSRDGDFQSREVVVTDEAYLVKDARGAIWRMWVRPAVGVERTVMQVELVRAENETTPANMKFRASSFTIDGNEAPPSGVRLELFADGTYRAGTMSGRYVRDEGGVTFDGPAATWGRGTFSLRSDALVFKYMRFNAAFEVHYDLSPTRVAER
jgi:hypothetical protein